MKGNSATESRPKIGIWLARWSKHIIYLLAMITSKFTRTTTNKVEEKKSKSESSQRDNAKTLHLELTAQVNEIHAGLSRGKSELYT